MIGVFEIFYCFRNRRNEKQAIQSEVNLKFPIRWDRLHKLVFSVSYSWPKKRRLSNEKWLLFLLPFVLYSFLTAVQPTSWQQLQQQWALAENCKLVFSVSYSWPKKTKIIKWETTYSCVHSFSILSLPICNLGVDNDYTMSFGRKLYTIKEKGAIDILRA